MFINFSNHPYGKWDEKQKLAAEKYGEVKDIPFPEVPPTAGKMELRRMADRCYGEITEAVGEDKKYSVIHLTGEHTLNFLLVSRLLQNGYRVITSTSQRNTVEEGNKKITTFEFEQFREYDFMHYPQPSSKSSAQSSAAVSKWILAALAALDLATVCGMCCLHSYVWFIIALYIVCAVFIWLLVKWVAKAPLTGFSPVILTKLLGNAIAPSKLGVAYLLVFVIHLGWLTDSTFNIISSVHQGLDVRYFVPLCCSIGGLVCIVGFFPDPYKKKNEDTTKVIVSGMSVIGAKQWTDLNNALVENAIDKVEKTNIFPLVRMLVNHEGETCKMLILKSNMQIKKAFSPIKMDVKEDSTAIETLKREICIASTYSDSSETEDARNARKKLYEEYNVEFLTGKVTAEAEFEKFLTLLIKMFAHFEFPKKLELIKKMEVEFTGSCDYNNYADCFDTMAKAIQKYDNDKFEIEFNITPGTALVSSVMTLLAIDGDKKLYYHEQAQGKTLTAEEAIKPVDKNKLPIENLLSQALEKFAKS